MVRLFIALSMLMLWAAPARAQQAGGDAVSMRVVWYTHYNCPAMEAGTPGATPETPIALEDFDELYYAAMNDSPREDIKRREHERFHCRWVRLDGFVRWMDYYHYRARVFASAADMYVGAEQNYILENFSDPNARRSAYAQRRVTLVGRFYDMCAAADREQQAEGEQWMMLLGPCHYSADNGLTLADVRIEAVHDAGPQYILGEHNRPILGDIELVARNDPARDALVNLVRTWAASVQRGPEAYADESLRLPAAAGYDADDRTEVRENLASPDGYAAYLAALPAFQRLNGRRAQVEVFWDAESSDHDQAVGCICLRRTCADRWPLILGDADNFLGDAACVDLSRRRDTGWSWL